MSAILPFTKIDSDSLLADYFTPYQMCWIEAEDPFHAAKLQVCALAEKSVRVGWTFCDGFKNVRKRLRFPNRDYLFVTKDWPSALEYMNHVYDFADLFGYTRAVLNHGDDVLKVKALDSEGRPTSLTEEVKIGYIKFDNGSRIIAFSSNPYAMAVYGGDVGLDEFAKHPNAKLLWETAQARVTWAYDIAVWSSHDGQDTLFNQFVRQARAACDAGSSAGILACGSAGHPCPAIPSAEIEIQNSKFKNPQSPWNLYFRVTLPDAAELGLVEVINRTRDTSFNPEEFVASCSARAGSEEVFQQSYMCNPLGAAANYIVEWSALDHCRLDYEIIRVHFEHSEIVEQFGSFSPHNEVNRRHEITDFIHKRFLKLFQTKASYRMGFDVAASGQGDLAVIYIDEVKGEDLWLRGLFSCRTEDWDFLQTVLFQFLSELQSVQAAGDASGLGRQICWDAASHFGSRFHSVNFSAKKHDLGEQDIAADFFALRKSFAASRWLFSESRNDLNPNSHCDIAWAGALATHAHMENRCWVGAMVC